MKIDANPLLLAQIKELTDRVRKLEAQHEAMYTVVDTLLFTLRHTGNIPAEFIADLHEEVGMKEQECQDRLGHERPEWEWQALAVAVSFLKRRFEREFSNYRAQFD